jgi:enoyl-CoA hydratase
VANREELIALAEKMMNKIIGKGPIAVAQVIKSVNAGFAFEQAGYEAEADGFGKCAATQDFREGTSAFLEKRPAVFKGK